MQSAVGQLADPNFIGQAKCKYVVDPMKKTKEILGVQEKIEI